MRSRSVNSDDGMRQLRTRASQESGRIVTSRTRRWTAATLSGAYNTAAGASAFQRAMALYIKRVASARFRAPAAARDAAVHQTREIRPRRGSGGGNPGRYDIPEVEAAWISSAEAAPRP